MKMELIDVTVHGATVHGHPIAGIDPRVVHDLQLVHGAHNMQALAAAVTDTFAHAVDAVDEGHSPGALFYAAVDVLDDDGVTRAYLHAERTAAGHVVYYPAVTDSTPRSAP